MSTCVGPQGSVPTRGTIRTYYQEQMMKNSRESGLDYRTQDLAGREEEEGVDQPENPAGGLDEPETKSEPETVSGGHPKKTEPESGGPEASQSVLGFDEAHSGSSVDASEEPNLISGANRTDGVLAAGLKLETEPAEENPECIVAKTSRRPRPKLFRMERVQSSPSLTSEEPMSCRYR